MVDFTSTQLSWILIGACSIGGTGYMTMDSKIIDLDKKVAVITVKAENSEKKLNEMSVQLTKIEDLLINQKQKGSR